MRFYDSRIVASMIAFAAMTLPTDGYAVEQSDTLVLSLDRCIEIALSDNPTIKVADMEITALIIPRRGAGAIVSDNKFWRKLQSHTGQADHVHEHGWFWRYGRR